MLVDRQYRVVTQCTLCRGGVPEGVRLLVQVALKQRVLYRHYMCVFDGWLLFSFCCQRSFDTRGHLCVRSSSTMTIGSLEASPGHKARWGAGTIFFGGGYQIREYSRSRPPYLDRRRYKILRCRGV